jgi:hypothetical protein
VLQPARLHAEQPQRPLEVDPPDALARGAAHRDRLAARLERAVGAAVRDPVQPRAVAAPE